LASVGGTRGTFLPPDPRVDEPFRLTPQAALRVAILGGIALVVFGALFLRLWALEVLSGQQYLRVAQNNQLRSVRLEAPRGAIRDRNGKLLVGNRPSTAVQLWPADLPDKWYPRFRELRLLSQALGVPVKEMRTEIARRKADPLTPVTIKESARRDEVNYLLEHRNRFPGLRIADSYVRMYPQGAVAAQLFGYVTEVSPEQLKRKPVGIKAGDKVGQTGIESAFDGYLRGEAGAQQLRVDALGTPRGQPTPSRVPRPGNDLLLTIDLRLQRAAQRALAYGIQRARDSNCYGCWDANGGAIVALDPHDGSVLAMASAPTYQPSVYTGHVTTKALAEQGLTAATARAKNYPALNRALVAGYPPGSTFKPVTAIAALQEHLVSSSTLLPCTGTYTSPADRGHQVFANWDPYVNQGMDLPTALAYSCDTYFYQLGDDFYALPPERGHPLQAWASRLGFGHPTGIEVGPEYGGLLPTPEWRQRHFRTELDKLWKPGDSIQLAIGQKDLLVTPMQMARFYALIANGGKLVTPHLLLGVQQTGSGGAAPHPAAPAAQQINIDPGVLDVIRRGLLEATHASFGTSSAIFGGFPVAVAGKTGTAEKAVDPGDGIARLFNQSWWCGYGPYDKPKLVVCALIENGGHGGSVAAPTALKVFEQFFHEKGPEIGPIHSD
jgi:penicillin-binding protein 2